MFEEQEDEYSNQNASSNEDEVRFTDKQDESYNQGYQNSEHSQREEMPWENCVKSLEDEDESVEFLLNHEKGDAVMMPGADPDKLEEDYDPQRYQVMGRRRRLDTADNYDWEPIRDISGPTENQKMMANLVAGTGVGGFRAAEGVARSIFGILSSLAK
jgi:hypothetical protein